MSEETLTFKDGTVYEDATALQDGDNLYLYMNGEGLTMHDAFLLLENAAKTETIVGKPFLGKVTFYGRDRPRRIRSSGV